MRERARNLSENLEIEIGKSDAEQKFACIGALEPLVRGFAYLSDSFLDVTSSFFLKNLSCSNMQDLVAEERAVVGSSNKSL